jgi:hypothetical protein
MLGWAGMIPDVDSRARVVHVALLTEPMVANCVIFIRSM